MVSQNGEARQDRPGSGNGFNPIGPVHRRLATLTAQANSANEEISALFQALEHTLVSMGKFLNLTIGADGFLYGLPCGPIGPDELVRLRSFLNRTVDGPQKPSVVETFKKLEEKYGPNAGKSPEPGAHRGLVQCNCLNCQTEQMVASIKSQLEKDNPGATVEVVALDFNTPLVKTGPGGDFTKETRPSDLEMSKATRACLAAIDRLQAVIDGILPKKSPHDVRTTAATTNAVGTAAQSPSNQ